MPDPIQSSTPTPNYSDFTCNGSDEPPPGPRCEPQCGSTQRDMECDEGPSEQISALVAHHSKPLPGNTNAERAAETPAELLHFDYGLTKNGSVFVSAALLYGKDSEGTTVELGSLSAQLGAETEVQFAAARSSQTIGKTTISAELLTGSVALGTLNKDGSVGVNVSKGYTVAGLEVTTTTGGSSATFGMSRGDSAEVSSGTRDADGDGYAEWCMRYGGTVKTVGGCIEDPRGWNK
ncbi:MAG: hypothetical protein QM756_22240 [Polyangiaceae bacterium]